MYLIDTDILSYAVRGDQRVLDRFVSAGSAPLLISTMTLYEIRFGIERSPRRQLLEEALEGVADLLTTLPVDDRIAGEAATIRAEQEARGIVTGPVDPLIAATSRIHGLTLVTHNVKHFNQVPGLAVEDWLV